MDYSCILETEIVASNDERAYMCHSFLKLSYSLEYLVLRALLSVMFACLSITPIGLLKGLIFTHPQIHWALLEVLSWAHSECPVILSWLHQSLGPDYTSVGTGHINIERWHASHVRDQLEIHASGPIFFPFFFLGLVAGKELESMPRSIRRNQAKETKTNNK